MAYYTVEKGSAAFGGFPTYEEAEHFAERLGDDDGWVFIVKHEVENKMKYILKRGGYAYDERVTEEQLMDIFRSQSFTIFNERDYEAWKDELFAAGRLEFAEGERQ